MNRTGIEYLDYTWNPIAMRCTPISEGCTNCWHRRMAKRLAGNTAFPLDVRRAYAGEGPPVLVAERLMEPVKRKKAARIGVQFMGDLFHKNVPTHFIIDVWRTMRDAPQHTFQILTKRPYPMLSIIADLDIVLPNVWLGVSVENQAAADERIPLLLQTPAAVRFVSLEPLLGPVDLNPCLYYYTVADMTAQSISNENGCMVIQQAVVNDWSEKFGLDWVIVGGESGPGARPMHPDWARDVRDQCQVVGVPYFHKQNGEWLPGCKELLEEGYGKIWTVCPRDQDDKQPQIMWRVGKKRAGRFLDGQLWEEYPR